MVEHETRATTYRSADEQGYVLHNRVNGNHRVQTYCTLNVEIPGFGTICDEWLVHARSQRGFT